MSCSDLLRRASYLATLCAQNSDNPKFDEMTTWKNACKIVQNAKEKIKLNELNELNESMLNMIKDGVPRPSAVQFFSTDSWQDESFEKQACEPPPPSEWRKWHLQQNKIFDLMTKLDESVSRKEYAKVCEELSNLKLEYTKLEKEYKYIEEELEKSKKQIQESNDTSEQVEFNVLDLEFKNSKLERDMLKLKQALQREKLNSKNMAKEHDNDTEKLHQDLIDMTQKYKQIAQDYEKSETSVKLLQNLWELIIPTMSPEQTEILKNFID